MVEKRLQAKSAWALTVLLLLIAVIGFVNANAADRPAARTLAKGLSPKDELATFQVAKGFRAELVACEPNVIDPVCINFDEDGRMYVTEMPGYPNDGVATGHITSGRIKLLEDRDGDGFYEHATTFAEGLRLPTCAMPWQGGAIIADAPDIIYLKDTDDDGRANSRRRLYTGFDLSNSEQLINGLQWGLDNWVHGCAGGAGGTIRSLEKTDLPAVELRGRGVRFHPEKPGSLEPTSGGGQYGLAADDWEQWFVNTNSQHLRHIVLPDHYLRRNPLLAVGAVTLDIPDHGAACKVSRISPFEAWRVERTRRRREGPEAQRFPPTELVPGGFVTSGCSPVVYTADLFPAAYRGNTFICDPANNLIHRDILAPHGATFVAQRADLDHEFIASTDNWFRPVYLTVGPDGALYVADFYREIIETPLSLPDDFRKTLNLDTCSKGRIWRIVPEGARPAPRKPALSHESAAELVAHLADANAWWRLTAQRLLVERQDRTAVRPLEKMAKEATSPQGRVHALWTLQGLQSLDDALIVQALEDRDAHVREQALRLAEDHLATSAALQAAVAALADDADARVRFQSAFTLGEANTPEIVAALARLARHDHTDSWTQTALLSSCYRAAPAFLEILARDKDFAVRPGTAHFFTRLAALVGARAEDAELGRALNLLRTEGDRGPQSWQVAILEGLGQGLQNSQRRLSQLWEQPPAGLQDAVAQARPFFERAAVSAKNQRLPVAERAAAARLLAYGPYGIAAASLQELLAPQNPSELQLAGIRALAFHDQPAVADMLLASWSSYSPAVRREVLEAVFARPDRLPALLKAIKDKRLLAGQLEPFRIQQLRKLPDRKLRAEAVALLAGQVPADRQKVVESYRPALDLKAAADRGKELFKKTCATCHRLENVGTEVGPDLLSALRTKTREGLLIDLFDPGREVDPRYINYVVTNKAGRLFTGIIASETASSITLRRAEKAEDTILRSQIDEIQATAKSLMPENLETQLNKQDTADLIAYLLWVVTRK